MKNETNPDATDATELDDLFADDTREVTETKSEDTQAGAEDVLGKGEVVNLSLEELKAISGREFKSKEEYLKHYENLKKLVGNQDLAKERKEKEVKPDKVGELEKKIAEMEKAGITKDFLLEVPTAKEHLELVEAYAEKQGITLSEAWNTKFANLVESSQKNVINKNRVNPIQSQQTAKLVDMARGGDESAQDALINSVVWGK